MTGYIVVDNEGTIHGYGATVDSAEADMERTMEQAGIELLDDGEDSTALLGSWTFRSNLKTIPATTSLLADVKTRGGNIAWGRLANGVAGTIAERDGDE
jgi:hypothetical protein